MNNHQELKIILSPLIYFILIIIISTILALIISSIPFVYNIFRGDYILNQHIKEVVGNKTNDAEIASALLTWSHENIIYPNEGDKISFLGLNFALYRVQNRTKIFFREVPASWTIKMKIGRCGEDARYFVEVMNKLGYNARMIRPTGWDHSWAEYYTSTGIKVILDPSSDQLILNKTKWMECKNVTKIEALYLNGTKEDITLEYLNENNNNKTC